MTLVSNGMFAGKKGFRKNTSPTVCWGGGILWTRNISTVDVTIILQHVVKDTSLGL